MGFLDFVTHPFGIKHIRIATVGIEASGKTFLLSDIEAVLHKVGYDIQSDNDMMALPISRFNSDAIDDNGKVERTASLGIRPRYVSNVVKMGGNHALFQIEILDVPGETFSPGQMSLFYQIVAALTNKQMRKNQIFTEYIYQLNTKQCRLIAYQPDAEAADQEPAPKTSPKLTHFGGDDTGDKIEKTQFRTFAEAQAELFSHGFKLKKRSAVSCQHAYDHFLDYMGDSFYRAIYDAWDVLEPVSVAKMNEERDNFRQNMRNPFYNLYYCAHATDIVICDKVAIPAYPETDDDHKPLIEKAASPKAGFDASESRKVSILYQNLYTFKTNKHLCNHQNWYIAFKGIDCVIKAPLTQDNLYHRLLSYFMVNGEVNRNAVYSFFTLLLACKLQRTKAVRTEDADPLNLGGLPKPAENSPKPASTDKALTKEEFYEYVKPFASEQDLKEEYLYKVYCKCLEDKALLDSFFSDASQYQVPNSSGDFFAYVKGRMDSCLSRGIVGTAKDVDHIYDKLLIPSHVYFCGTLLDQEMRAHLQTTEQRNVIPEAIHDSSSRFFFGSSQLFCDIFQRNGVPLLSPYDATGILMTYYYGH